MAERTQREFFEEDFERRANEESEAYGDDPLREYYEAREEYYREQSARETRSRAADEGRYYAEHPEYWDPSAIDCRDFASHDEAQSFYDEFPRGRDPFWLDDDRDGIACEHLP